MARETLRRHRGPAQSVPQRPSRLRLWFKRRRHLARPAAFALLAAVAVGAAGFGVMSAGGPRPGGVGRDTLDRHGERGSFFGEGIANLSAKAGLVVREVTLEGNRHTPPELVRQALAVRLGDSTLGFSPQEARERLETIAWIERAHVERHLPGTIRVAIEERQPFAIWQRDNRFAVIDRQGRVVATDNVRNFGRLPLVVGAGAERGAAAMIGLLRGAPEVEQRVEALVRVGERRWNLKLRNGAEVMLPEGHEAEAVARLAELQAGKALLDRPLVAIDMRQPDKLVLRQQPQAAPVAQPQQQPQADPAAAQRARGGGRG
jgi:cell division protein FtsQ